MNHFLTFEKKITDVNVTSQIYFGENLRIKHVERLSASINAFIVSLSAPTGFSKRVAIFFIEQHFYFFHSKKVKYAENAVFYSRYLKGYQSKRLHRIVSIIKTVVHYKYLSFRCIFNLLILLLSSPHNELFSGAR